MATCTLFSVSDADLEALPAETSLPGYDDQTERSAAIHHPHTAELGLAWEPLHRAFGALPAGEPLGFLEGGGAPFRPLEDAAGGSSGRYFSPDETVRLLAAVAKLGDDPLMKNIARMGTLSLSVAEVLRLVARVRIFLAEAVEGGRGVIVHKLA